MTTATKTNPMRKILLITALISLLFSSCKKPDNVFDFSGTMVDYLECTTPFASISDLDFGLVLTLDTPDSIGKSYTDPYGEAHPNCVILYRTKSRYKIGEKVKGSMYLDDNYSKAYCQFHYNLDLPEGVCYSLR